MVRPSWPTLGSTNYVTETQDVITDLQDAADISDGITDRFSRMIAGEYYTGMPITLLSNAKTANLLVAHPFPVSRNGASIDRIGVVVTAGGSGSARLGIYAHDHTTFRPAELIADVGEVALTTSGVFEITVDLDLTAEEPDFYIWLAVVFSATPTVNSFTTSNYNGRPIPLLVTGTSMVQRSGVSASHTYGPLPDPFPTAAWITSCAAIFVRSQ